MNNSIQHKLNRVRPPRVKVTFDVLVGETIEHKELPFIVGVVADLSGMRSKEPLSIKDRSFVEIDNDNFNDFMSHIQPSLKLSLDNRLLNNNSKIKADLVFESMDDFEPINLIQKIPALAELYESRIHLKDLLSKMDANEILEEMLLEIMNDPLKQSILEQEILESEAAFQNDQNTNSMNMKSSSIVQDLPPVDIDNTVIDASFDSPFENLKESFDEPEDFYKDQPIRDALQNSKEQNPSELKAEKKDLKKQGKDNDDFF
jgi:type VI secretion system protein ImpB